MERRHEEEQLRASALMNLSEMTRLCAICSAPGESKCSNCLKVGYCGREHQKSHWKTHRVDCFPMIHLWNSRFGDFLASTRNYFQGDVLLTEKPIVISPSTNCFDKRLAICLGCCKVLPGEFGTREQVCRKCSWPLCHPKCEKISRHSENECEVFAAVKDKVKPSCLPCDVPMPLMYNTIQVLRILLMMKNEESLDKFRHFRYHTDGADMKSTTSTFIGVGFVIDFIQIACKQNFGASFITWVFGIVLLNAQDDGGSSKTNVQPGDKLESYVYELSSNVTHGCFGNITREQNVGGKSGVQRIVATTEIRIGDRLSEFVLFSRTYWNGIVERRRTLYWEYYFWCTCRRCADPTELGTFFSAVKCKKGVCPGFLIPTNPLSMDKGRNFAESDSTWICSKSKCKNEVKYSVISKIITGIQEEIARTKTFKSKLRLLERHANVTVHENHFTLSKLRYDMLSWLLEESKRVIPKNSAYATLVLNKIVEFASKSLELADKFVAGPHVFRGELLFYLAYGKNLCLQFTPLNSLEELTSKSIMDGFGECARMREEAKKILGEVPEGSKHSWIFNALMEQDKKLLKSCLNIIDNGVSAMTQQNEKYSNREESELDLSD